MSDLPSHPFVVALKELEERWHKWSIAKLPDEDSRKKYMIVAFKLYINTAVLFLRWQRRYSWFTRATVPPGGGANPGGHCPRLNKQLVDAIGVKTTRILHHVQRGLGRDVADGKIVYTRWPSEETDSYKELLKNIMNFQYGKVIPFSNFKVNEQKESLNSIYHISIKNIREAAKKYREYLRNNP
jgi:hypothetical protein